MLLGYARVSTLDQIKGTSLDEQRRVITGLAMARGVGQFDTQIYTDDGVSGTIPLKDRPQGGQLWLDAKQGDIVMAAKLDRLFRDALDAQTCYKEFKRRGVDLILYDMGIEPVTRDGMSKFFFTMLSAFADLERNRINERMAEGKRAKKAKGGHIGGEAPYGFKIVGEGRDARLEGVPEEQEVLALVRANRGLDCGGIRRVIRSRGYKTRGGRDFQAVQIQRMRARELRPQ